MRKTVLVLASVALAMLLISGVAWAANVIRCESGSTYRHPCSGTNHADIIRGTKFKDYIYGFRSWGLRDSGFKDNDTIYGYAMYDYINGGNGRDKLYGGLGDDEIDGGLRDDLIKGSYGEDTLRGNFGGGGGDTKQQDALFGGPGADILSGDRGVDHLYGGSGNDYIAAYDIGPRGKPPEETKDFVFCGDGHDIVQADKPLVDEIAEDCEQITYETDHGDWLLRGCLRRGKSA